LQVPGSVASMLEFRLGEQDRAALGFAVHVPHYLAQAAYPAAAVTLLESVTRATGLSLPDEALREAARRTDEEIGRQVEASEEIADLVQALERQYDAFIDAADREGLLADEAGNMPTAEELGAQFHAFLAQQQGRADSPDAAHPALRLTRPGISWPHALSHLARRQFPAARLADRPGTPPAPVPAPGPGPRAVAGLPGVPGRGAGRCDRARHPGAGAGRPRPPHRPGGAPRQA